MKRKSLYALIALSLGSIACAQAQDYDDRYYVAPYAGAYINDDDRLTDDGTLLLGIGIGRYLNDNTSIDVFVDRTQRGSDQRARAIGLNDGIDSTMIGTAVRYYFGDRDSWQPYIMAGAGAINHRNGAENGWDAGIQVGGGLQKAFTENTKFRAELGYRYDFDSDSIPGSKDFGDFMINLGVTMAIGAASESAPAPAEPSTPAAAPAAPQTDCSTLDDDADGVNNCDDKCPNTASGTITGPDGCAQEVVIDLRGVNFLFDRPKPGQETSTDNAGLLPGSIEILDQAVDVLKRYPNIKVEVAGHTDSTGPDAYNQSLSERRARVVYTYLTEHGVDASRLVGPNGYGEARPIDSNDTKEGRQRNRRTELSVEK